MKFCTECGNQISDTTKFCGKCGASQPFIANTANNPLKSGAVNPTAAQTQMRTAAVMQSVHATPANTVYPARASAVSTAQSSAQSQPTAQSYTEQTTPAFQSSEPMPTEIKLQRRAESSHIIQQEVHQQSALDSEHMNCPYCNAVIVKGAKLCRFCHKTLDSQAESEEMIKCPYCCEKIIKGAKICRYCSSRLTDSDPAPAALTAPAATAVQQIRL